MRLLVILQFILCLARGDCSQSQSQSQFKISDSSLTDSIEDRDPPSLNMAWKCSGRNNGELVSNLMRAGIIKTPQIAKAMKETDRGWYVIRNAGSRGDVSSSYQDSPIPIGWGSTISAPHMHAMCLEALKDHLKPGGRVLDVGSGSGYLSAVMGRLLGPSGRVIGIEHIPELVTFSQQNLRDDDPQLEQIVDLRQGDGREGYPEGGPYDAIHVGAAAASVPQPLLKQLRVGGRMIIPVGGQSEDQWLEAYDKTSETEFRRHTLTGVRYVPLTSQEAQRSQF